MFRRLQQCCQSYAAPLGTAAQSWLCSHAVYFVCSCLSPGPLAARSCRICTAFTRAYCPYRADATAAILYTAVPCHGSDCMYVDPLLACSVLRHRSVSLQGFVTLHLTLAVDAGHCFKLTGSPAVRRLYATSSATLVKPWLFDHLSHGWLQTQIAHPTRNGYAISVMHVSEVLVSAMQNIRC
jgi:hypothetical protein